MRVSMSYLLYSILHCAAVFTLYLERHEEPLRENLTLNTQWYRGFYLIIFFGWRCLGRRVLHSPLNQNLNVRNTMLHTATHLRIFKRQFPGCANTSLLLLYITVVNHKFVHVLSRRLWSANDWNPYTIYLQIRRYIAMYFRDVLQDTAGLPHAHSPSLKLLPVISCEP